MKFHVSSTSGRQRFAFEDDDDAGCAEATVNFRSLRELADFLNEAGQCIIDFSDGAFTLEVYDEYRE